MYDDPAAFDPKHDVDTHLDEHHDWVDNARYQWRRHRDSFSDDFWQARSHGPFGLVADWMAVRDLNAIPQFAVNRMKGWIHSHTASLFYRGFQADADPDSLYDDDAAVAPDTAGVRTLLNRFFATEPFAVVTEQAFTCGLLYGHCALYLREDPGPKRPLDKLTVEFMPPWECVWDRAAASREDARYFGRVWWVSKERAEQEFGLTPERARPHLCAKSDVLVYGMRNTSPHPHADKSYVKILDIYYPHATIDVAGTVVRGVRCVYLLDPSGRVAETLKHEPMKWQTADGLPACPIEPVVLLNVPEYPLCGLPHAATIYALELEQNSYAAWLAMAFKFDALRKLFVDYAQIDAQGAENLMSSMDNAAVKVKPGALTTGAGRIASWLESPPSPATGLQLRSFLETQFQAVQGAPQMHGQPTQYIPATESASLTAYAETMLGMLRSKMDRAVANIAQTYLRAASTLVPKDGFVRYREDKMVKELPAAQLGIRWQIRIVDGANTPAKTETNKRDLVTLTPFMVQLSQQSANPQLPPTMQEASKRVWDELVKRFGLPESMKWDEIAEAAPPAPPQAPPPPPGAPPQEEMPPEPAPPTPGAAPDLTAERQMALESDAAAEQELQDAFATR